MLSPQDGINLWYQNDIIKWLAMHGLNLTMNKCGYSLYDWNTHDHLYICTLILYLGQTATSSYSIWF